MKNIIRSFIAAWYLLGWMVHVYLAINAPQTYTVFGSTTKIPGFELFWHQLIMPNIVFFALLLAAYELAVGMLLINKGKWVPIGLLCSILFNLFLVQMGLGMPAAGFWMDFTNNHLPNILFILIQIPLLRGSYPFSISEIIKKNLSKIKQ